MKTFEEDDTKESLLNVAEELDRIQETDLFQSNEDLMWEIGEAIGYTENCIGMIEGMEENNYDN